MEIDDIHSCAICGKTVPTFYDEKNEIWRCESEAICSGEELEDTVSADPSTNVDLSEITSLAQSGTEVDND